MQCVRIRLIADKPHDRASRGKLTLIVSLNETALQFGGAGLVRLGWWIAQSET